jgi:hypothetical protein
VTNPEVKNGGQLNGTEIAEVSYTQ